MNGISLEIEGNPVSCHNTADDLRDLAADLQAVQPVLKEHAEIEDRDFSGHLGDEFRRQSARNLTSATTRTDQALGLAAALDQLARDMERAREMMDQVRALDPEGKVIVDDRVSPAFADSNWALFQQLHRKAGDARLFWLQAQNAYLKAIRAHTDLDPAALDSDVPFTPVNAKTPGSIRPLPDDYLPTPEDGGAGDPAEDPVDPALEPEAAPVGEGALQSSHTLGSGGGSTGVSAVDTGTGNHPVGQSSASHLPMQQAAMAAPEPMRPQAQFLEPDEPDDDAEDSGWQSAPGWQPADSSETDPETQPEPDPGIDPGPGGPAADGADLPGWQPAESSPQPAPDRSPEPSPSPSPGQPPVAVSPDPPQADADSGADPDQVVSPTHPTHPVPPQTPDQVAATAHGPGSDDPGPLDAAPEPVRGDTAPDFDIDDTAEIRPIVDDDLRRAHLADRLGTD